jgi:hypothetical protein
MVLGRIKLDLFNADRFAWGVNDGCSCLHQKLLCGDPCLLGMGRKQRLSAESGLAPYREPFLCGNG